MPDVKAARPTPAYEEQSVKISWRKGHSADTVNGATKTLIVVNQVALALSQVLEYPRKTSSKNQDMVKVGYVTLQQPSPGSIEAKHRRSPLKVFALWISASTTSRILLAIQVGRVSDRAVHVVARALTETITHQNEGASETFLVLDTYIPQTYVPSARPEARLYLDTPPVRFLSNKKTASVVASEGIEKFDSPNYVTGISAGVLACSVSPQSLQMHRVLTTLSARRRHPVIALSSSCRNPSTATPSSKPSTPFQASNP